MKKATRTAAQRSTNGVDPKQAIGSSKVPLELNPPAASIHMAMALKDGARKYGPFNWRETDVLGMTYLAAAKRHIDALIDGEDRAADSDRHHAGHAMASLAIYLDAMECGTLVDNRPAPGGASRLLEKFAEKKS